MALDRYGQRARDFARGEAAIGRARHLDVALDALVQQDRDEPSGRLLRQDRREADADLLAYFEVARFIHAGQRRDRGIRLFAADARFQQQLHHGLTALHDEGAVEDQRHRRLRLAGRLDQPVGTAVHEDIVPRGKILLGVPHRLKRSSSRIDRGGELRGALPA